MPRRQQVTERQVREPEVHHWDEPGPDTETRGTAGRIAEDASRGGGPVLPHEEHDADENLNREFDDTCDLKPHRLCRERRAGVVEGEPDVMDDGGTDTSITAVAETTTATYRHTARTAHALSRSSAFPAACTD
jgi:hypothetical protein